MHWTSIGHRSSAPINPTTGRQIVVIKHSVTGGMKYLLWLIKVCTEVEELIPLQITPLLLFLRFRGFFLAADMQLYLLFSDPTEISGWSQEPLGVWKDKSGVVSHSLKASSKLG